MADGQPMSYDIMSHLVFYAHAAGRQSLKLTGLTNRAKAAALFTSSPSKTIHNSFILSNFLKHSKYI